MGEDDEKNPEAGKISINLLSDKRPNDSPSEEFLDLPEEPYPGELEREEESGGFDYTVNDTAVQRLTNVILSDAVRRKATDIYYEFGEEEFTIKYRVDGEVYGIIKPPVKLSKRMREELKLRFGLLKRKPKLLTFWQRVKGNEPEMEIVSAGEYGPSHIATTTLPIGKEKVINLNLSGIIANGQEQCHLELFDSAKIPATLDNQIEQIIKTTSSGLIILSSPPDQGKTTTAYQMLAQLSIENRIIVAVERKSAYPFSGIAKIKANSNSGDYEHTLTAIRAYRPDILFFDDVSDERTAKEAVEYARSGQLVFVALTAKGAAGSLECLAGLDENIAKHPQDIKSLISQRLVRRVHEECEGAGCRGCNSLGYTGRVAAYQVVGSPEIERYREALLKGTLKEFGREDNSLSSTLDELAAKGVITKKEAEFNKNL